MHFLEVLRQDPYMHIAKTPPGQTQDYTTPTLYILRHDLSTTAARRAAGEARGTGRVLFLDSQGDGGGDERGGYFDILRVIAAVAAISLFPVVKNKNGWRAFLKFVPC
jgi:hypothetical protein